MLNIVSLFRKTVLLAFVIALALTALPFTSVYASGSNNPTTPPTDGAAPTNERLEQAWTRLQRVYERQGRILDRADQLTARIQNLLERMNENGKDTTALQAALDAFEQGLKDAHPIYESVKGIINSHQGFDADGKVIDHEKAITTLQDLNGKLKEIRQLVGEPGKALREAVKAYRDARHPAADTSSAQG